MEKYILNRIISFYEVCNKNIAVTSFTIISFLKPRVIFRMLYENRYIFSTNKTSVSQIPELVWGFMTV